MRCLRMQEKRKPIWPSLYLEMIIEKKHNQSINQSKDNQKIRDSLDWYDTFLQKKVLHIF